MKFECTYKHINFAFSSNKSPAGYTCRVHHISKITEEGIELEGNHDPFMSNREVVGVSIQNFPELKRFPRGFGRLFPNLLYMQVLRCSITTLEKNDLADLSNLQGLWLSENFIEKLPDNLFTSTQGLQYLSFHKNKLKHIGAHILTPLKNLKQANFTGNTCINVNYNEKPEELRFLKQEIAFKCPFPRFNIASTSDACVPAAVDHSLLTRVNNLEKEIQILKSEKEIRDKRISALEKETKYLVLMMEQMNEQLKFD